MNEPIREEERLTTADLASAAREEREERRARDEDRVERRAPAAEREAMPQPGHDDDAIALFADEELKNLRTRWDDIQAEFVDEPSRAVEQADRLVASTIQRLAESFANGRAHLEQQGGRGDGVSTEDLRLALRRYRSFFHRLLSV